MSGKTSSQKGVQGPFRAEGLEPGGYWEISHGYPVQLSPAGPRHGSASVTGAMLLATDPAVMEVGVDVGHKLATDTVRAPDVSVGGVPSDQSSWAVGAPPLPIEYADEGTSESDLRDKIEEYFGAGAKWVWVVRLVGARRVEVYSAPGVFLERSGQDLLEAPGVLALPLPAAALYDRSVALDISLRNLLRRAGYRDLDAVRKEGIERGIEQGIERGIEQGIEQGIERGIERGIEQGIERGKAMNLRSTIEDLCGLFDVALNEERRRHIAAADLRELERIYDGITKSKRWPDDAR